MYRVLGPEYVFIVVVPQTSIEVYYGRSNPIELRSVLLHLFYWLTIKKQIRYIQYLYADDLKVTKTCVLNRCHNVL